MSPGLAAIFHLWTLIRGLRLPRAFRARADKGGSTVEPVQLPPVAAPPALQHLRRPPNRTARRSAAAAVAGTRQPVRQAQGP